MSEFGFYSTAGDRLATTLISGICRDVDNRSVTPYQAMDRLSDAFERISVLDNGIQDTDVLSRIVEKVNKHFAMSTECYYLMETEILLQLSHLKDSLIAFAY